MPGKGEFLKTQEFVYEMKASEVMTTPVVTVTPQTSMGELREILRSHRISGTPVVANERLVGIISIEDFIYWLMSGPAEATVEERMTETAVTVHEDEPLVKVVSLLERHGFGRLPAS